MARAVGRLFVAGAVFLLSVVCAAAGAYAAAPSGYLYGWGQNAAGELGTGDAVGVPYPTLLPGIGGVVSASTYNGCTAVVTYDGSVYVCGNNASGQLGDGTTNSTSSFIPLTSLSGMTAVAVGQEHMMG